MREEEELSCVGSCVKRMEKDGVDGRGDGVIFRTPAISQRQFRKAVTIGTSPVPAISQHRAMTLAPDQLRSRCTVVSLTRFPYGPYIASDDNVTDISCQSTRNESGNSTPII